MRPSLAETGYAPTSEMAGLPIWASKPVARSVRPAGGDDEHMEQVTKLTSRQSRVVKTVCPQVV